MFFPRWIVEHLFYRTALSCCFCYFNSKEVPLAKQICKSSNKSWALKVNHHTLNVHRNIWKWFTELQNKKTEAATRGVLRNVSKFTGKQLCQSLFLIKLQVAKKENLAQVFSCEFYEISKSNFFTEHLWATASKSRKRKSIPRDYLQRTNLKLLILYKAERRSCYCRRQWSY